MQKIIIKIKHIYLVLSILGFVLPLTQFIPWVVRCGVDVPLFFAELFSTKISAFLGLDIFISALVVIIFICIEGKRIAMQMV